MKEQLRHETPHSMSIYFGGPPNGSEITRLLENYPRESVKPTTTVPEDEDDELLSSESEEEG